MTTPARHWRSYGTEPLPTPAEALDLPLGAFPSWFLKITCERCFKDRMLNETHASDRQREMPLRVLLFRMRHDGCGGRPARAELLTGIEGVSSTTRATHRADGRVICWHKSSDIANAEPLTWVNAGHC